jgi:hypothetical protein
MGEGGRMTWASETAEYIQHNRDNLSPEYLKKIRKHWRDCYEPQIHLLPTTWLGKQRLKHGWTVEKLVDLSREHGNYISKTRFHRFENGASMPQSKDMVTLSLIFGTSQHTMRKHLVADLLPGVRDISLLDDYDQAQLQQALREAMHVFPSIRSLWMACRNQGVKTSYDAFKGWIHYHKRPKYSVFYNVYPVVLRVTLYKQMGSI